MTTPFMRAYTELLVATCHRRGAHAIGGMAAFVPEPQRRERDQERPWPRSRPTSNGRPATVSTGPGWHIRGWSPWPGRPSSRCSATGRTSSPGSAVRSGCTRPTCWMPAPRAGQVTMDGLTTNISVALRYLAAWVGGSGAVAIDNLMEDAATVEISRAQVWQWIHNEVTLAEGPKITRTFGASAAGRRVGQAAPDDGSRRSWMQHGTSSNTRPWATPCPASSPSTAT